MSCKMSLNQVAPVCIRLTHILIVFAALRAPATTLSAGVGFGNTTSKNESTETEGPFTQAYALEHVFHSRLALGVEHLRSLATDMNSSTSMSGVLGRYYFNAAPMKLRPIGDMPTHTLINRDISVFAGIGGGFGQSSRLPNAAGLSSNAAGFYVSPRGGAEYQIGEHWGVRGEFIYALTIMGKGSINMMSLGFALYWIL
jgi:hypothetical protein